MYPDEIGTPPAEDHNAVAPEPAPTVESAFTPEPQPEAAIPPPVAPPETQPGPLPQPQYAPAGIYAPAGMVPPQPIYGSSYNPNDPLGDVKGISIAAMIVGIASIVFPGIVLGVVGLVLSIQAQKKTPAGIPNNYAKAGKVCSIIGLVLSVLLVCAYIGVVALGLFGAAANGAFSNY